MASTVLPNGVIIPEKYSRDWYADLYHNWQELDNLLGGGTPKDGTLTIQKNGDTVGTFSANQATNETINIEVPAVNDATLTIQKNGTTVDTFTANSSTDKTVNITVPTKTSDLTNDSGFITSDDTKIPLAGSNQISGSLIPSTNGTVNLGTSANKWKSLNGINPGALSLPSSTGVIDVSSNITVLDGTTANKFTPQINGWLHINGTGTDAFIYAVQGRVGMKSAGNQVSYRCAVLVPVIAGAEVAITCKLSTLTWANITPCQGNV